MLKRIDRPAMTIAVDLGQNATKQRNIYTFKERELFCFSEHILLLSSGPTFNFQVH